MKKQNSKAIVVESQKRKWLAICVIGFELLESKTWFALKKKYNI